MAVEPSVGTPRTGALNDEVADGSSGPLTEFAPSPMTGAPFAVLAEVAAILASGPNGEGRSTAALAHLRTAIGARLCALELGAPHSSLSAVEASEIGALAAQTDWLIPLKVGGEQLGVLRVQIDAPRSKPLDTLLAGTADMLAAAIAHELRARSLEHELVARVREVAEHRQFIERIVDSLPVGLYVVDRDYRIHAWNRKRETGLQGVSRDEAIGRTIFEVLHRQPAAMLKREFDEVFASGRMQQFQMESTATGDVRTFRISKIPMRLDDERVTHVITIGEDITDWRAALDRTAQTEKLAALGQLAAGVMHEINNPLATIAACAESLSLMPELLAPANDPAKATAGARDPHAMSPPNELLHIIDLEVQRCKRIVNGLLDFARPKPASRQLTDLTAVVRQGLFLLQHHPRYKRVKVITELEESVPVMVNADADQLVQVLLALAINALDATPDGQRVTFRSRLQRTDDGVANAVFEVSDEGPGVPRAYHAKVFEPFFTTKAPGKGTGLGLAICYGIVSDHNGVLELAASDSPGATFRVVLPAVI